MRQEKKKKKIEWKKEKNRMELAFKITAIY